MPAPDMEAVAAILHDLTPEDSGREDLDGHVLRFEGFSDLCVSDATDRTSLPKSDPRHLAAYDDVYAEVLREWALEEGSEPVETGMSGPDSNPTLWAVYAVPE